jgi:predicted nucleic-acid-binding Zn-ribbon protein
MSNESSSYSAGGIVITCTHCKNNSFHQGKAQLNTRGATFLGFDWLNKSATTLVCSKCGLIQWFAEEPGRI